MKLHTPGDLFVYYKIKQAEGNWYDPVFTAYDWLKSKLGREPTPEEVHAAGDWQGKSFHEEMGRRRGNLMNEFPGGVKTGPNYTAPAGPGGVAAAPRSAPPGWEAPPEMPPTSELSELPRPKINPNVRPIGPQPLPPVEPPPSLAGRALGATGRYLGRSMLTTPVQSAANEVSKGMVSGITGDRAPVDEGPVGRLADKAIGLAAPAFRTPVGLGMSVLPAAARVGGALAGNMWGHSEQDAEAGPRGDPARRSAVGLPNPKPLDQQDTMTASLNRSMPIGKNPALPDIDFKSNTPSYMSHAAYKTNPEWFSKYKAPNLPRVEDYDYSNIQPAVQQKPLK